MMRRCIWLPILVLLLPFLATQAFAQDAPALDDQGGTPSLSVVFAPRRQAVISAEVATTVLAIHKEFGQGFAEGEVLIEMDATRFEHQRERAGAMAAAASNAYNVNKQLYDNDSASLLDVEEARKDLGVASAEVRLAKDDIGACTIAAPYPGRVDKVLVHEHELVQEGQPLMEIVDDSVLRVKTLLPSSMFKDVAVDIPVDIQVNEIGTTVQGRVSHISATLDPASGTFEIYAEVDNSDRMLRAGMTGYLALPVQ